MKREHKMIKCTDCGKQISEDHATHCDMCGAPLCEECGSLGLCSTCAELWGSEIDLEDVEAEEE
jgi:predicted amidophosphoribosyltransferase